jgi:hypothetical protein
VGSVHRRRPHEPPASHESLVQPTLIPVLRTELKYRPISLESLNATKARMDLTSRDVNAAFLHLGLVVESLAFFVRHAEPDEAAVIARVVRYFSVKEPAASMSNPSSRKRPCTARHSAPGCRPEDEGTSFVGPCGSISERIQPVNCRRRTDSSGRLFERRDHHRVGQAARSQTQRDPLATQEARRLTHY